MIGDEEVAADDKVEFSEIVIAVFTDAVEGAEHIMLEFLDLDANVGLSEIFDGQGVDVEY